MRISSVLSIVASVIVLAVAIFFIAVAIKSGVDGTSFVDTINNIFGVAPADPTTPVDPVTPDADTTAHLTF